MWDKPDSLNMVSNVLIIFALLLSGYGAIRYAVQLPVFALREVQIGGAPRHVTMEQVEDIVRSEFKGNFFTLDLKSIRAGFEKLPWVRKVNARRQWPDRLEVVLEEHVPLARWGAAGLVNTYGEVFNAAYDDTPAGMEQGHAARSPGSAVAEPNPGMRIEGALPMFVGPATSAKEIAIQYGYFKNSLAAIGQSPIHVQVSPRRAWQIRLDSGLVIELGREHIESRLDRFVAVYGRTLQPLQRKFEYVDLRYPNGFAVRVPELKFMPQEKMHSGATKRG